MNRDRFKQACIFSLCLLFASGWIGYLSFTSGMIPGIYPLAVWYSSLLSPTVSIAVLLSLQGWILLPVIAISLGVFILYARRHQLRTAFICLLAWPILLLLLLPAMVGFTPGQRLAVEPWGQVYRTAYSSLWLDDNYGDVLIFKCNSTGMLCRQVHKYYASAGAEGSILMKYDAEQDLLRVGTAPVLYARSKQKQLCSRSSAITLTPSNSDECSEDGDL